MNRYHVSLEMKIGSALVANLWATENTKSYFSFSYSNDKGHFTFEDKNDAMIFKLAMA